MAKFEEDKIINVLHPEKAEIGKNYWIADDLLSLKEKVEINGRFDILDEIDKNSPMCPFRTRHLGCWQFLYPYEEPPKQRMTNIQLMEWLAKENGMFKYKNATPYCYIFVSPLESELNNEVEENVVIRTWNSEEWIEPTVDIYERDCKGGKE